MRITPVSLLRLATKCCGRLVDVGSPWCREPVASVTWGPQAPRTAAASANPRFFNERSLQATSYRRPRRWEAEMDTLVERCGGLDVHKAQVTATVRIDERGAPREQHTQTFATTTRGLLALADWLASWQTSVCAVRAALRAHRCAPWRSPGPCARPSRRNAQPACPSLPPIDAAADTTSPGGTSR